MRIGPDEGNSGAIIRWGKHLDKGVWLRTWRMRALWTWKHWKLRKRYIDLGVVCLHF